MQLYPLVFYERSFNSVINFVKQKETGENTSSLLFV